MGMKRKNIISSIVFLITILITILPAQEKNKFGKYPASRKNPNALEYPQAIQRLDKIKSEYYNELQKNKDYKLSESGLKEYAVAFINSYLYYANSPKVGYVERYFKESYPIGAHIIKEFENLGFPYNFLIMKKGVILGEVIDDQILPKKQPTYAPPPPVKFYEYVATVKIIDDIFDSYEGDTILVRHDHSIFEEFNEYNNSKILFAFRPGATIQRADSVQHIHVMGKPNEFMFVKDSIIYDPNSILKITGKPYRDFKRELQDFIELGGIAKW